MIKEKNKKKMRRKRLNGGGQGFSLYHSIYNVVKIYSENVSLSIVS